MVQTVLPFQATAEICIMSIMILLKHVPFLNVVTIIVFKLYLKDDMTCCEIMPDFQYWYFCFPYLPFDFRHMVAQLSGIFFPVYLFLFFCILDDYRMQ